MTSHLAHFFYFSLSPHRLIELHSPDSRNTLILRCKDTATAHSWFVAIHTNIMALLPQVLAELNTMLGATSTAGGSQEVKHIAWLAEQVGWEVEQGVLWFHSQTAPGSTLCICNAHGCLVIDLLSVSLVFPPFLFSPPTF